MMFGVEYCRYISCFAKYSLLRRTMEAQPLQAVVLCGGLGNRMTSLTDHIPKCMLPIVGIPMFWYPLNFLQKNSIRG